MCKKYSFLSVFIYEKFINNNASEKKKINIIVIKRKRINIRYKFI